MTTPPMSTTEKRETAERMVRANGADRPASVLKNDAERILRDDLGWNPRTAGFAAMHIAAHIIATTV